MGRRNPFHITKDDAKWLPDGKTNLALSALTQGRETKDHRHIRVGFMSSFPLRRVSYVGSVAFSSLVLFPICASSPTRKEG